MPITLIKQFEPLCVCPIHMPTFLTKNIVETLQSKAIHFLVVCRCCGRTPLAE